MSGAGSVRAAFCVHDDGRAATVEIAFMVQNSGPGVSVVACPECAGRTAGRRSAPGRRDRPPAGPRERT
ncbi:hypothetical protein [Streptomyces sp. URMC 125]|uniref:hypothetical protein n=1 Tax=Streptomyces sp. URMC 125 TaxID=3423419 RepID=UPI003F1CF043